MQQAVKYSAKLSYGEAREALQELAQVEISEKSVWRLAQNWGEAWKKMEEKEAAQANHMIERELIEPSNKRLGASLDGCMIYIRGEAWKELKCGCIFEVEEKPAIEPETKEEIELGHATQISYISHLGGPEAFGEMLWSEAKRRKWQAAVDTQVVADGAAWIWNLVTDYLYDAHQLVDWYHAVGHLGKAAELAFGEGTAEGKKWVKQHETLLFQGHAEEIAHAITGLAEEKPDQSETLRQQAGYFVNHQHRMNYLEMRADGWVIGSGAVESGGKRFKDRFTKAGMRWSRDGAEHLLPVRGALMSRNFNQRWRKVYNSPPN